MVALRLVRLIEGNSDKLANELVERFRSSPRTKDMKKVPAEELQHRAREILRNLSDWLLNKTEADIERRYQEIGARRAAQGVALGDLTWSIVFTKEYLWDFLQRRGFLQNAVQIYAELELLRLLDQFFDRAVCSAAQGYEQNLKEHGTRREARSRGTSASWMAALP